MEIVRARAEMIPAVSQLTLACGLGKWSTEDYLTELERKDSIFLAAIDGENLIGFVVGRFVDLGSNVAPTVEIYNVAVDPAHRRKGSGSNLIKEFLQICDRELVSEIWLEVRSANGSAIEMYRNLGFAAVGRRKAFYVDPEDDALLMVLRKSVQRFA
ncbi:MAG: ribosomal protein S18-alanine N-acetyltransferase [Acidobacteria bacterium]|nr:ribosomal protein S18-alanine N-acetyltransferase [Acidobacteriota bacterium]